MPPIRRDSLWKSIIEDRFEHVLEYFYAEECHLIDMEKGFEFLDKELAQLRPESEGSERVADKLVRAYLKDGGEAWFLIHIEVQGYADPQFPKRMYEYFYRIQDRYQRPVTALALLTYAEAPTGPQCFEYSFMGTKFRYEYRSVRLMDKSAEAYAEDGRLFALVLAAARATLERGLGDEALLQFVKDLALRLFKAGHSKEHIRQVIVFLQSYVRFGKPASKKAFHDFSDNLTYSDKPMGIIELVREHLIMEAREEGLEEGRQEGRQEGREEGRQEGREEGIALSAKAMLEAGMALADVAAILKLDVGTLRGYLALLDGDAGA